MAAPSAGGAARHQRTAKACARGGRWRHVGLVAAATSVPHQEFQCRAYQTLDLSEASCTHRERPRGGVRVRRRSLRRPRAASHELVVRRCGSQHEARVVETERRAGLEPPSGQVGRVRRSRLSAAGSLTCRSKTSLASSSPRSRCRMSRGARGSHPGDLLVGPSGNPRADRADQAKEGSSAARWISLHSARPSNWSTPRPPQIPQPDRREEPTADSR